LRGSIRELPIAKELTANAMLLMDDVFQFASPLPSNLCASKNIRLMSITLLTSQAERSP